MVYLDYAATTPMREEALEAYVKTATEVFGNESSLHDLGSHAEKVLNACREQFASSIGGQKEGIYFTGSGSEANILAVRSLLKASGKKGGHIVTTAAEHASLFNLFEQLGREGYEVSIVALDEDGLVQVDALRDVLRDDTVLAAIHHGNPEIGVLQDVARLGAVLAEAEVLFHVDAVQTFTEVLVDVHDCAIDSLAVSAHKIYGPKGCGFAYIRPEVRWVAVEEGATHEKGFRPGTVDVPSIAAFAVAAHYAFVEREERAAHYARLRAVLEAELADIPRCQIIGARLAAAQLPHIAGMVIDNMEGQYTLLECNRRGVAISTGTACRVNEQDPSRTMMALGHTVDEAKQFIRISFGKDTTEEDVLLFVRVVKDMVAQHV